MSTDDASDRKSGRMQLKACSYIDEIFIDKPKVLYHKFKKLGIYEWQHVYNLAKNDINNEIMAFTFSGTELFQNPITFTSLKRLYKTIEKKHLSIQSPLRISNELFLELYRSGSNL